ncbi:hypothetical protein [Crateriforma spongiae]|uniref:hypothetical protein n=1 Tax=Crateriforma spongiae TaxID=2724528 RepID=UPI00144792CB|nr:hypothetical protein [Crateriforma spongiae]
MTTTTTLTPVTPTESPQSTRTPADRLQAETTAVRLRIRWPGTRKTLSRHHRQRAADTFAAQGDSVSVSKKLIDTGHPTFRATTAIRTQVVEYWKRTTLPYVEPGTRLLRRRDLTDFDTRMSAYRDELAAAVGELNRHYSDLIEGARQMLGDLFDRSDYVDDLRESFAIDWDFPSTAAPDYLLQISPGLYQAECDRIKDRFDEAVRLTEQAFAEELGQLVGHLAERLSGQGDGSPKVFRDSAVTNLREFFDRFERLNIRSDDQLDRLVEDARRVLSGVGPQELRDQAGLRQNLSRELARVEASLDGYLTDRPRRRILRPAR